MAGFEMKFPDTTSPTLQFSTAREPVISGSSRPHNMGRGVQVTSNQKRQFSYRYSPAWNEYVFLLTGLSETERGQIDTFLDGVDGAAFYIRAGASCGMLTSWTKVKLASEGQRLPWAPQANQKWTAPIPFREAA